MTTLAFHSSPRLVRFTLAFTVWMVGEERASRGVAQQALYRKAERAGRLRDEVRSASETVQAS